jgi:hypothetical protein
MPQGKIAMVVCREVISQLETAQEAMQLSDGERNLLKLLKSRVLGLATIEKSRARQRSKLTWLRKGDTNTKNFHLMANVRKIKNFIHSFHSDDGLVLSHPAKHEVIFQNFLKHTCTYFPRQSCLNMSELGWEPRQLYHLEQPLSLEEIQVVIMMTPREKAPEPNGFIGLFFSVCWNLKKEDIVNTIQYFYLMNKQGLNFLNSALVVLIPKKSNPQRFSDYRPISLIHSFAKMMTKLLANRLGYELEHLISINQKLL